MAMVQLQRALGGLRTTEILDHFLAFGGGVLDAWLAENLSWGYIIKNVAIPIANIFLPLPKGLVHQAESSLGVLLYALLFYKKE